jgi:hypothetical protein
MTIQMFDPVGDVEIVQRKPTRVLETLNGRRVGCVFNQHVSAIAFWKAMEGEVERTLAPARIHRVYKANTWAPAPRVDANRVLEETDYVLVGVGA